MYSTDLLLKVPKTILLTGISGIDGKPISAIAWKALLSIMYFFPERDHCEITVPITILHMMFGYYSNSECNRNRSHHVRRILSHLEDLAEQPLVFGRHRKNNTSGMVCIESVRVDILSDLCSVTFSHDFIQYWENTTEKTYKTVNLQHLYSLHTLPAVILYLRCVVSNSGVITISTAALAKLLTGDPDYPYKLLKKDKFRPAIAVIYSNTGFRIHFKEILSGNRVQKIQFTFRRNLIVPNNG